MIVFAAGCRGEQRQERDDLASLVDSLTPSVERAAGIPFRAPLKAATRTREQLRAYLMSGWMRTSRRSVSGEPS
jgi:hypothetical protein